LGGKIIWRKVVETISSFTVKGKKIVKLSCLKKFKKSKFQNKQTKKWLKIIG
jgi:hypothetical protein